MHVQMPIKSSSGDQQSQRVSWTATHVICTPGQRVIVDNLDIVVLNAIGLSEDEASRPRGEISATKAECDQRIIQPVALL
jgi:hypothetical protein